jgi:hypothetical protein
MLEATKDWCFAHHDDISGWTFMLHLLNGYMPEKATTVFAETLRRTGMFRWRNESVWYFLRNLATTGHLDASTREPFLLQADVNLSSPHGGDSDRRILEQTRRWLDDNPV